MTNEHLSRKRPYRSSSHRIQKGKALRTSMRWISKSYSGDYFYRKATYRLGASKEASGGRNRPYSVSWGYCRWFYVETPRRRRGCDCRDMLANLTKFKETFGDRFYAELQWNNIPEQHLLNKCLIKVAGLLDLKLVSTCDSHYPTPDSWRDREVYKRLGWLGKMPAWMDDNIPESVEEIGYELYPKNAQEMWESYKRYSDDFDMCYSDDLVMESITNTATIAFEQIEDFLPDTSVQLPSFMVPSDKSADEALSEFAENSLAVYLRGTDKTTKRHYRKRLAEELDVISSQKFSEYFLATKAITDFSWNYCFVGPARGSAGRFTLGFPFKDYANRSS